MTEKHCGNTQKNPSETSHYNPFSLTELDVLNPNLTTNLALATCGYHPCCCHGASRSQREHPSPSSSSVGSITSSSAASSASSTAARGCAGTHTPAATWLRGKVQKKTEESVKARTPRDDCFTARATLARARVEHKHTNIGNVQMYSSSGSRRQQQQQQPTQQQQGQQGQRQQHVPK